MLVITRRPKEKVMIGDDITVMVTKIAGNNVFLGIKAPPNVKIMREEIYDDPGEKSQRGVQDDFTHQAL